MTDRQHTLRTREYRITLLVAALTVRCRFKDLATITGSLAQLVPSIVRSTLCGKPRIHDTVSRNPHRAGAGGGYGSTPPAHEDTLRPALEPRSAEMYNPSPRGALVLESGGSDGCDDFYRKAECTSLSNPLTRE
jgi:hypothetical protein